jgi:hypothetical protein
MAYPPSLVWLIDGQRTELRQILPTDMKGADADKGTPSFFLIDAEVPQVVIKVTQRPWKEFSTLSMFI